MDERSLEVERDYRRQVSKVYYRREEDFESLQAYNDYLEEVEDIIQQLVCEETRSNARQRLDEIRVTAAQQTAHNRLKLDADRRAMADRVRSEIHEKQKMLLQRLQVEQEIAEQKLRERERIQAEVVSGRSTVVAARKILATGTEGLSMRADERPSQEAREEYKYMPFDASSAMQQQQQQQQVARPVSNDHSLARPAKNMVSSLTAAPELYESDPDQLLKVQLAGGFDPTRWKHRYWAEAFLSDGIGFHCLE